MCSRHHLHLDLDNHKFLVIGNYFKGNMINHPQNPYQYERCIEPSEFEISEIILLGPGRRFRSLKKISPYFEKEIISKCLEQLE